MEYQRRRTQKNEKEMILEKLKKLSNDYLRESKKDKSKEYYKIATKNIINSLLIKLKDKSRNKEDEAFLTEQEEISVLKNLRKKSLESIKAYTNGNRLELAEKEKIDLEIIEKFLPKELGEEETTKIVKEILKRLDTNKIGLVMKELKIYSNINMGIASKIVKKLLI